MAKALAAAYRSARLWHQDMRGCAGAGTHGTTFGGNPFCCAAARTALSVVNKPEFLKEVQRKGEYLKNAILAIGSDKIKTVRGMGLMLGIVADKESRTGKWSTVCLKRASWRLLQGKRQSVSFRLGYQL